MLNKIRYFLIKFLAGDMPVILNMTFYRPNEFKGSMLYWDFWPEPSVGMCCYNTFVGEPGKLNTLAAPTRVVKRTMLNNQ
jgi:hypothetical protein